VRQLLGLAVDRGNFALNEGENYKIKKPDCGTFQRERKRTKCASRSAVIARLNRLKKKKFLESLERDV
jgi:hypothetical protein